MKEDMESYPREHHCRRHGRERQIPTVGAIPSLSLPQQQLSWRPRRQAFLPFAFVLVTFPK